MGKTDVFPAMKMYVWKKVITAQSATGEMIKQHVKILPIINLLKANMQNLIMKKA